MRSLLCILFSACILPAFAQGRVELCRSDNATVYNRLFKREETGTGDDYQITIEIENDSFDNLYYSRKEYIMAGEKDPLLPPYLTIQVLNSADPSKNEFYVHGGITLHMSAYSTQIFKVTMKRNE